MRICPNCQTQLDDDAMFCTGCGTQFIAANDIQQEQVNAYQQEYQNSYTPPYDPYDHTAEFDPKDISDNKVMAMLVYLMGWLGIIVALLGSKASPYVAFHIRQALKFTVTSILMMICTVLLCWTLIVPIAAVIMTIVLFVIKIICFFQICSGKAKEPAIIRSLKFMK